MLKFLILISIFFSTLFSMQTELSTLSKPLYFFPDSLEQHHQIEDRLFKTSCQCLKHDTQTIKLDFKESYQKSYDDFVNLQLFTAGFVYMLWLLPESVTQWDQKRISETNLYLNWRDNVTKGPVMDQDKAWINSYGHTFAGAYYYTLARHNGMSVWEASTFNLLMSTFYWEYGVEAFFEVPSKQDLVITPLFGSLLGEAFYKMHHMILENDGEVLGSKALGRFFIVFFNPEGALADFLAIHEDRIDLRLISRYGYYRLGTFERDQMGSMATWMESYVGYQIDIRF